MANNSRVGAAIETSGAEDAGQPGREGRAADSILLDAGGMVTGWPPTAAILTGRTSAEVAGRNFASLCQQRGMDSILESARTGDVTVALELNCAGGDAEAVEAEIVAQYGPGGRAAGFEIRLRPASENEIGGVAFAAEPEPDETARLHAHASPAFLVDSSDDFRILDSNDAAARLLGRPRGELAGLRLSDLVEVESPSSAKASESHLGAVATPPFARLVAGDGAIISCELSLIPIQWDLRRLSLCVLHDVSGWVGLRADLTKMNMELSRLARHDHLTGLFNRPMFLDTLELANARASRLGGLLGVLYIDLDGFKPVNDRFGHDAGDRVLIEVGRRLKAAVRSSDVVARLGGDEFGAILENLKRQDDSLKVARNIIERLSEPFDVDGECIELSASIGAVVASAAVQDSTMLVSRADRMMYEAKAQGRGKAAMVLVDPG